MGERLGVSFPSLRRGFDSHQALYENPRSIPLSLEVQQLLQVVLVV